MIVCNFQHAKQHGKCDLRIEYDCESEPKKYQAKKKLCQHELSNKLTPNNVTISQATLQTLDFRQQSPDNTFETPIPD